MAKSKVNGKTLAVKQRNTRARPIRAKRKRFGPAEGQKGVLQWLLAQKAFSKETARPKSEGVNAGCMAFDWESLSKKGLIGWVKTGKPKWAAYLTEAGKQAAEADRYTMTLDAINALSVEERIRLVEAISQSIEAEKGPFEMSEELKQELERRIAEDDAHPDEGLPWEEVKARMLARLKR